MSNVYKFRLDKTYQYMGPEPVRDFGPDALVFSACGTDWLIISPDGQITISRDYCWDGCTPKFRLFD